MESCSIPRLERVNESRVYTGWSNFHLEATDSRDSIPEIFLWRKLMLFFRSPVFTGSEQNSPRISSGGDLLLLPLLPLLLRDCGSQSVVHGVISDVILPILPSPPASSLFGTLVDELDELRFRILFERNSLLSLHGEGRLNRIRFHECIIRSIDTPRFSFIPMNIFIVRSIFSLSLFHIPRFRELEVNFSNLLRLRIRALSQSQRFARTRKKRQTKKKK